MNPEEREHISMTAAMDGKAAIVRGIGKTVELSEMEVICLATFAEIGLYSLWSKLDNQAGRDAANELAIKLEVIRRVFTVERLSTSTAAVLLTERIQKYICGGAS